MTVSLVSHGHGDDVREVLSCLAVLGQGRLRRVVLTFNVPEPGLRSAIEAASWPFELLLLDNPHPAGFGTNHNRAFRLDGERDPSTLFAVLNPDVRWHADPFAPMLPLLAAQPRLGLVYPVQQDAQGRRQDHERWVPTPARLWARHRPGGRPHELAAGAAPHWVNAAFMLLRREAFASVGGFDEAYYMYCEDVDLCLRLQLAGWRLARADDALVLHTAQRASRRDWRHVLWHVSSLLRLWRSRTWRAWHAHLRGDRRLLDSDDRP